MACEHRCVLVKISILGEMYDSGYNGFPAGPDSESLYAQDKFALLAPLSETKHTS